MGVYEDISRRLAGNPLVIRFVANHLDEDISIMVEVGHQRLDTTIIISAGDQSIELGLTSVVYPTTPNMLMSMVPGLVHMAVCQMQPSAIEITRQKQYLETIEDGIETFNP